MFKKFSLFLCIFLVFFSTFSKSTVDDSLINNNNNSTSSNTYMYPTTVTYTSSTFGNRELFGLSFHDGVDFPAPQGSQIFATKDGFVTYAGFTKGYGNMVTIMHSDGYKSLYGHMSENFIVTVGENIKQGTCIGFVGPKYLSNGVLNGYTTGPHLHFSIYNPKGEAVDPLSFELQT